MAFSSSRPAVAQLRLGPPPADPAATLSYDGATPGPLLRLKKGEDLKLRLANKLTEPTALSLPGLRTRMPAPAIGGLTQPRLQPGASADIRFAPPDSGFNLYRPHAGATDAGQQGRGLFGPIVVEEARQGRRRSGCRDRAVATGVSMSAGRSRTISPILRLRGGQAAGAASSSPMASAAPFKFAARPGARVRLRLGNAATARLTNVGIDGAKTFIVAVDGQPERAVRAVAQPVSDGPRRAVRTDVRHAARGGRERAARSQGRRRRAGPGHS